MIELGLEGYKHFVSADWTFRYSRMNEKLIKDTSFSAIKVFIDRAGYRSYINEWEAKTDIRGIAIIETHGDFRNGEWVLLDGQRNFTAQEWINQNDGKYSALVIHACNPVNSEIFAKKSLVLHANRNFSLWSGETFAAPLVRLFVPNKGYVKSVKTGAW